MNVEVVLLVLGTALWIQNEADGCDFKGNIRKQVTDELVEKSLESKLFFGLVFKKKMDAFYVKITPIDSFHPNVGLPKFLFALGVELIDIGSLELSAESHRNDSLWR